MLVSDVPINQLRIGQVVKFPTMFGVIISIQAEVPLPKGYIDQRTATYFPERFSVVTYLLESGRIVTPMFHMNNNYQLVDRILHERVGSYNAPEIETSESEFFYFKEICDRESTSWALL
jgi:hypothetical protein